MDFLLRDATEKKLNIRNHISCLMNDLKDAKIRLSIQEERSMQEMRSREVSSEFFFFFFLLPENLSKQTGA
jgi:hypothetical protein